MLTRSVHGSKAFAIFTLLSHNQRYIPVVRRIERPQHSCEEVVKRYVEIPPCVGV